MECSKDMWRKVSYCPWPAMLRPLRGLQQRDANANASVDWAYQMDWGQTNEEHRGRVATIMFNLCLLPTWRMAERERPKFLVRHREWDNIMAVWQPPVNGREAPVTPTTDLARAATKEVVWDKPSALTEGGRRGALRLGSSEPFYLTADTSQPQTSVKNSNQLSSQVAYNSLHKDIE